MSDMTPVIIPKSDQISADDLLAGPMTIRIARVTIKPGEQPVTINYDGDNGRPFKPCKSMARVMVALWGADSATYAGKSLTIYRDPHVKWGGLEVGGIRISHMSDIAAPLTLALTQTKGKKQPFTVNPLAAVVKPLAAVPSEDKAAIGAAALVARIGSSFGLAELAAITADAEVIKQREWLASKRPMLASDVDAAVAAVLAKFEDDAAPPF